MFVFVYHPDIDVLAAVVGKIRDRGIETFHAADARVLVERAAKMRPAALVFPFDEALPPASTTEHDPSERDHSDAGVNELRRALPGVAEVMIPTLDLTDEGLGAATTAVVDALLVTMAAAVSGATRLTTGSGDVRGDLAQFALPDLLQMLSMGRKTGTLAITTSHAAGELKLHDGDVVDAMFRRAEGMKAVVRLLGEREGAFHFIPDTSIGLRRIREPISQILMEGMRHTDEIRRLRGSLGLDGGPLVLALQLDGPQALEGTSSTAHAVASALGAPRTLEDLLDDLPQTDLEVLQAIGELDARSAIRRMPLGDLRPSLAGPEGMVVLRGLARRLRPRGFRGAGRLVMVGAVGSIRMARQALARLAEASPGADVTAELSADRAVESTVTLQLGESVSLEVVTIADR
ncbi:MAG: DUF4388 domain-containing protein, partial [Polyangiales bacterium]